jgi:tetratricopeptide (TPR) repeat protein
MDPLLFLSHNLEDLVTERHLLEAVVHLKSTLLRPLYRHESQAAYHRLKSYQHIPNTLTFHELVQQFPSHEMITSLSYWNLHLIHTNSHPSSGHSQEINYDTDFMILFSKKHSSQEIQLQKKLQFGIPFDLKYHFLKGESLKLLRVYDYSSHSSGSKRSLENLRPTLNSLTDLLSDPWGGFLYHCGKRDVYHWKKEILSMNYYDSLRYQRSNRKSTSLSHKGGGDGRSEEEEFQQLYERGGRGRGGGGEGFQDLDIKERMRRYLLKRSYSYRPLAFIQQRRQNIWEDLGMTKPPPPLSSSVTTSRIQGTKQPQQQGATATTTASSSFRNLLKVITEDEDDDERTMNSGRGGRGSGGGGRGETSGLMEISSHLFHSDMTTLPLNINLINQHPHSHHHLHHHLYHAINDQFIQLMSQSSHHHSPPSSLFHLPSTLPPSQRISTHDISDTDPLSYELELPHEDYLTYTDLILTLVDSPSHLQHLLALAEYFLQRKLLHECYFTLLRVVEITSSTSSSSSSSATSASSFNQPEEYCLVLLYTLYFTLTSQQYFKPLPMILKLILTLSSSSASSASSASSSSPSPMILAYAARLYHLLQLTTQAEELYLGAMLLDPLYCHALHGYSLLLIDRGDYQLACRYLNRITTDYVFYPFIRLQYVWIQELLGHQSHLSSERDTTTTVQIIASTSTTPSPTLQTSTPGPSNTTPYLDALLHQYHLILPHCGQPSSSSSSTSSSSSSTSSSSNKHTLSLVLASIGHAHHITQNNLPKAIEFYSRSLKISQKNGYAQGMYACALTSQLDHTLPCTEIHLINTLKQKRERGAGGAGAGTGGKSHHYISRPGLETELIVNTKDEEIDATFRKSLFLMKGRNRSDPPPPPPLPPHTLCLTNNVRWIILLAYGEFVTNRIQDMNRGEEILWEAARFSFLSSLSSFFSSMECQACDFLLCLEYHRFDSFLSIPYRQSQRGESCVHLGCQVS